MSTPVLVLGKSGSGKSTSIRTLQPETTFLINIIGKDLPFKGGNKNYQEIKDKKGNRFTSDSYVHIEKALSYVDKERPEIKTIVIDDSQYLIVNEFMKRHSTSGKGSEVFNLYNEIADHFWNLIWTSKMLRNDLVVVFLHHSELSDSGDTKAKTIGKLLDDKVDICGMFTIVLNTYVDASGFWFETKNFGNTPAKTPIDMFTDGKIPNDLNLVVQSIHNYNKEG